MDIRVGHTAINRGQPWDLLAFQIMGCYDVSFPKFLRSNYGISSVLSAFQYLSTIPKVSDAERQFMCDLVEVMCTLFSRHPQGISGHPGICDSLLAFIRRV